MGNAHSGPQYGSQEAPGNPLQANANPNQANTNFRGGLALEGDRLVGVGGLRADLASLLLPYRQNQALPSIHETNTIRSNVNISKDSLLFVRDEGDGNLYRVQFQYDAYTPCVVKLYFLAKETLGVIQQSRVEFPPVSVEKGYGKVFKQPAEQAFDVSTCTPEELSSTNTSTQFPVVITIQSVTDEKGLPTKPVILSQTTYATLLHCADNSYAIKAVKQTAPHNGQSFNLHDIYGLDYTGERESEGSRECVVCLSEARDTTILPCNHMCLCAGCAEMMRTQTNKCPICRAPVKKLLTIKLAGAGEECAAMHGEDAKVKLSKQEVVHESDDETEEVLTLRRDKENKGVTSE